MTPRALRPRLLLLGGGLVLFNFAAWAWAMWAARSLPALPGLALLAYGLGLRHAVDADHIAAIDNATRKLVGEGGRPVTVGLFFSLGHSTVVLLGSMAAMRAASWFHARVSNFSGIGEVAGPLISILFLLLIGAFNGASLVSILRQRRGDDGPGPAGPLTRLFAPLFRLIGRSWHLYPLGFLFGLGFDTTTEVGLLGLSASQASSGLYPLALLVLPVLFSAGMSLVDSLEGVLMLKVYGWAVDTPRRKEIYNILITSLSVAVALGIAGWEAFDFAAAHLERRWRFAAMAGLLGEYSAAIGGGIIVLFMLIWAVARHIDRLSFDPTPRRR